MTPASCAPSRRCLGTAALWLALAGLGGCVGAPPGITPDSYVSYDRTFDAALGAMRDQKMVIDENNRRQGTIMGTRNGDTITATLQPQLDGTIRVVYKLRGEAPADAGLLKRVVDAYNERMSGAKLLPTGLL